MTTTLPPKAVQFNPPPAKLIPDLTHSINQALTTLQGDQRGALVLVGTKTGDQVTFNAAVVARVGDDWKVQGWIGKSWGKSVEGGASAVYTW